MEDAVQVALEFLRAGGVVTLAEWRDTTAGERAALVSARALRDAELIARIGLAVQDPMRPFEELAALDGGEALGDAQAVFLMERGATERARRGPS